MDKRRLSSTTWHLLLVALFGLPLVSPLLRWTAVPCTHDGHLHYHRIAAMRHAWENGLPFTRWLPDLAFGYGYPFFIYREPVPLYAGLLPHLLGLPLPAAENLIYILAILAGGWFMYLWVRDILGARAGIVAAVAYMAAPYILIDALIRGNSPESVAMPLFPLLLWSGRRWLLNGTAKPFLLSVLGLAALALSHNISLLLFTPTLGVYLLAVGWLRRLDWRQIGGRLLLLFGLGLGMTAFYSGGALLEMGEVTLQQSTTTRNNDFHYNFTTLGEIFGPVAPEDPSLINPPLSFRLGWVPTALAVVGLASLFWKRKETGETSSLVSNRQSPIAQREQQGHIILTAVAAAIFLLLSLPFTLPIWENVPLIDFLQFPWRMVGRAALPIAFLSGTPFADGKWQVAGRKTQDARRKTDHAFRLSSFVFRLAFFAALALLILEALPMLYPTTCKEEAFPTINKVHAYEHNSGLVGVDPEGSYFPKTVQRRPKSSALEADFLAGQTPQRFDVSVLPGGSAILSEDYGRLSATIHLTTPTPFTARYLSFDFPGWTAAVDGRSVPITPTDPDGLIAFPVPAGEHVIIVRWQSTPLRTALLGFSVMMMAAFAVTAFILADSSAKKPGRDDRETTPFALSKSFPVVPLLLIALALIGLKFLIIDKVETPLRRIGEPSVANPIVLQAAELRMDGFNLSQTNVESGATFDIDMAWTAVAPPTADYQSNIWLVGPDGLIWSEKGTERPRLYEDAPTTRHWLPDQWAWDSREVQIFSGTPPGQYDIVLTLFEKADLQPRTLLDANGAAVGPTAVIGQINVTSPSKPVELTPQYKLETAVADLTLLGYNQDRTEAAPGDPVLLTLFWEKPAQPPSALSVFKLQLLDGQGATWQIWEIPPVRADYPPSAWQPGERLRGQHAIRLPANLESGVYRFRLNHVPLGKITIEAPDRIFEQPETDKIVNIPFYHPDGDTAATLVGRSVLRPPSSITLLWQAQTEMPVSYRVFVHLVDESGQIIAQSDSEPANWTRPTTGWASGEYILDTHTLTLPDAMRDGRLTLRVGLYDPQTNQRLLTDTADFALIQLP